MGTGRVEFANTLRGIAAFLVLISHYYGTFWTAPSAVAGLIYAPPLPAAIGVPAYIPPLQPFPLITWGPFGVALFFLISGFVIPFSLRNTTATGFMLNRAFRLVPVYIVGFSASLLAIYISTKYFGVSWPFTPPDVLKHYIPGLRDVLNGPSIDGIVWTLEVEVKFYVVCALAILLFRKASLFVFAIPVAIFIAAHLIFPHLDAILNKNVYLYRAAFLFVYAAPFVVFMFIGTAFHYAHRGDLSMEKCMAIASLLFFIFCVMMLTGVHKQLFIISWSYGAAAVVFVVSYALRERFKPRAISDFFANISYPLYVVHGVAGYALMRIMIDLGYRPIHALIAATSCAIIAAWLMHRYIEKPFQRKSKPIRAHGTVAAPAVEAV